ncbi:MAG: protein kinase [Myxococcales bacterium]|nr:protein kinase [Myxococcales bacterium]
MAFGHIRERIGTVVAAQYKLLRMIGEGGMGAVFEAEHMASGQRVAVKLIKPEYASAPEVNARFVQEVHLAASIGHPNIIRVLDAGTDEEGPYLVLELLEGETLCDLIDRRPLGFREALTVMAETLEALQAAHGVGVVHRDIKPENIFLVGGERWSRIVLLDFGIAKMLTEQRLGGGLTRVGTAVGTPDYMSPEQASGGRVDGRADLWSVAAVLYECLAQVTPFDGESYQQLISRIVLQPPTPLLEKVPGAPPGVVALIERALQKEPAQRFASAAEMLAEMRRLLAMLPADDVAGPRDEPTSIFQTHNEPTAVFATPPAAGPSKPPRPAPAPMQAPPPSLPSLPPAVPSRRPLAGPSGAMSPAHGVSPAVPRPMPQNDPWSQPTAPGMVMQSGRSPAPVPQVALREAEATVLNPQPSAMLPSAPEAAYGGAALAMAPEAFAPGRDDPDMARKRNILIAIMAAAVSVTLAVTFLRRPPSAAPSLPEVQAPLEAAPTPRATPESGGGAPEVQQVLAPSAPAPTAPVVQPMEAPVVQPMQPTPPPVAAAPVRVLREPEPRGPRPHRVTAGAEPEPPGGLAGVPLSQSDVFVAFRAVLPELRGCYQGSGGALDVNFDVNARGEPTAMVMAAPSASEGHRSCTWGLVRRVRFPLGRPTQGLRFVTRFNAGS